MRKLGVCLLALALCACYTKDDKQDSIPVDEVSAVSQQEQILMEPERFNALVSAITKSDTEAVQNLVKEGVNLNQTDEYGFSLLKVAIYSEPVNLDIIEILLKAGAENQGNEAQNKALIDALYRQAADVEIAELLLKYGANPNAEDELLKQGALIEALQLNNPNPQIIKLLIDAGADVNQTDALGRSPLHHAVSIGNPNPVTVEFLLKNPNAEDEPLKQGALEALQPSNPNPQIIKLLIDAGADVNQTDVLGRSPLYYVVLSESPDFEIIKLLLKYGAAMQTEDFDVLDMLVSMKNPNLEVIEFLLQNGANPNVVNYAHKSPLMTASADGNVALVRLLLANGADPNFVGKIEQPALWWAVQNGQLETARVLLEGGADPDYSLEGITAISMAKEKGYADIVNLLQQYTKTK